jgi:serine/threonine-protein kinase
MKEQEELLAVARAIVEQVPVDWSGIESSASDENRRELLHELKVIATIVELHQSGTGSSSEANTAVSAVFAAGRQSLDDGSSDTEIRANRWGPLEILEQVAEGSFGEVYRARDTRVDREVALKLLRRSPGVVESLGTTVVDEARLLARVRHPNVVTVYGADRIDGRVGLWMEFIHGRTLEQILGDEGPFAQSRVISVGTEICQALGAVHDAGLSHRDVKAQNVMQQEDGRLVLMDFGAGHELSDDASARELAGTPLYLAPEILEGAPASVQSDLYSTGVLLYHLLTGSYPVSGRTVRDIREEHRLRRRGAKVSPDSHIPRSLCRVIERAIDEDAANRYGTAREMEAALHAAGGQSTVGKRRRKWVIGAIASTAVLSLTVGLSRPWTKATARPDLVIPSQPRASTQDQSAAASSPATARAADERASPRFQFEGRDWVLIAPFDNRSGESVLDGTLEYALERDLSNSAFVNVVPRDRIDSVLRLMQTPIDTKLDARLAREICLRDGAIRALIIGRVEKIGSSYLTTAQIVDPRDATVVASLSEEALTQAELLPAVRRHALRVREALGEMLSTIQRSEAALEKVTTPSLHALQLYSQASAFMHGESWQNEPAEQLLRQAVKEDDRFASAYILLAYTIANQGRPKEEYLPYAERAVLFADRTSDVERYFIIASYHHMLARTGGSDQQNARLEQALSAYQALMRIKPDHYWGVGNLYDVYRLLNREPQALETLVRVTEIRSDKTSVPLNLILAYLSRGQVGRAREYMRHTRGLITPEVARQFPDSARTLRLMNAYDAWLGKDVHRVRRLLDDLVSRTESGEFAALPFPNQAHFYRGLGRRSEVLAAAGRLQAPIRDNFLAGLLTEEVHLDRPGARDTLLDFLSMQLKSAPVGSLRGNFFGALVAVGRIEDARALLPRLEQSPPETKLFQGQLAIADGRMEDAVRHLQAAGGPRSNTLPRLSNAWELARGYRSRGGVQEAIMILEDALNGSWSEYVGATFGVALWIRNRELLADLYRTTGRQKEAEAIDADLLKLLAEADPDYPVLVRIKERYPNWARPSGAARAHGDGVNDDFR